MSRITRVDGSIKISLENGGSFSLNVIGQGMRDGQGLNDLGHYVGRLVSGEVSKIITTDDKSEIAALTAQVATLAKANNELRERMKPAEEPKPRARVEAHPPKSRKRGS